jgi:two-component system CitB family sensor kinase
MKPTGAHQPIRSWLARRSLASQMLLLQVAVVALAVAGAAALAWLDARRDSAESARQRALGVAETFAHTPDVLAALRAEDPAARLQPMAESVRRATGVDFVVVMRPDRMRYSHPNPSLIGGRFIGTIEPALAGRPFTETFTGTLGPSVRAVVPVPADRSRGWSPSASPRPRSPASSAARSRPCSASSPSSWAWPRSRRSWSAGACSASPTGSTRWS